jgi:anti-sigma factor RsiW
VYIGVNGGAVRAIDCQDAGEWLHKGADGRLSPREKTALDEHLGACGPCARRAGLLDEAASVLRRRQPVPSGFGDRVLRRLSQVRTPERTPQLGRRLWLPVAAAVLLVAGLSLSGRDRGAANRLAESPRVPVELELPAAGVRSVAVAGDFNGWDATRMLRGEDGVWRIRLSLPPGRYQYVFVVDEEKWMADPRATTVVDNGYSGTNSVLDVGL